MLTSLRHADKSAEMTSCRMATGRSTLLHLANVWKPDLVFMPCWVPEGVFAPFCQKSHIVFYKLNADLSMSVGDIALKLAHHRPKRPLVVAIQYFGFAFRNLRQVSALAHANNGIVLADCAHVLSPRNAAAADVILYSLNKLLPVVDGAILMSRHPECDVFHAESYRELPERVQKSYERHLELNQRIVEAGEDVDLTLLLEQSARAYDRYYKFISEHMQPFAQSRKSKAVELQTDLHAAAAARCAKSNSIRHHLNPSLFVRDEDAQFAFPVRCHGKRDEMIEALLKVGVLASTLEDRWDFIPDIGFDFEREFIKDHLLLPLGPGVEVDNIIRMCGALNEFA